MSDEALTALLNRSLAGDTVAADLASAAVYDEIRAIAGVALSREGTTELPSHDIHPTVLLNEIFLRIGRSPPLAWGSRRHFFGAVHQACDQVLIDQARAQHPQARQWSRARAADFRRPRSLQE